MKGRIAVGPWLLVLLALPLRSLAQEQPAATSDSPPAPQAEAPAEPASLPVNGSVASKATTHASHQGDNRLIEEIIVTAQKREENIRDVPISIQAFTQEKLDVLGIQSVQDIQRATPGLTVTNAAGFNIVFLRGVGSDAYLPGVDSSVPFYLDGVPLLGIQGTADTLGRIKRVEVLKGPQGTLFGQNSTGGAISIVTPDPDQKLSGDIKAEFGNYSAKNVVAYVNVPVTNRIAFNLSGFNDTRDNILHNESTGGVFDVYARGGRVKLLFNLLDSLSLTLNGNFQENSGNGSLGFQLLYPAPRLGNIVVQPAAPRLSHTVDLDSAFGTKNRAYILGGTFNWVTNYFDSKLIYAKQKIKSPRVDADFDGTPLPIASAHGAGFGGSEQSVRQDTAELQFLSNKGTPFADRLQLAAGLFYLSKLGGFHPIVFNVAPGLIPKAIPSAADLTNALDAALTAINLPPLLGEQGIQLANYGLIRSQVYSAYAQATYHLIDTVDFTGGLRYQTEVRRLTDSKTTDLLPNGQNILLPFPQGNTPVLRPKQLSVRGALQWRPFGPDDQFYTSWARGYKSPTYNTVNLVGDTFGGEVPLKAERVETTEIGAKTLLLGGNLQLNAAGFYTFQKNPLSSNVTVISGGIANFTNAGAAVIKGADGDFLLVPLPDLDDGLVITGGFSYLEATYTEFQNGRGYDDLTGLGFGDGGASLPARDLSGKRIPRVPKWSYQTSVSQNVKLPGSSSLEFGADAFYTSKIYFLPQNSELSKRDPVHLYNARASYLYQPWGFELTVFGNNLTNKIYADSAFVSDFGTALIANENPRMFGVRVQLSF